MKWMFMAAVAALALAVALLATAAGCAPKAEEYRALFESGYDAGVAGAQEACEAAIIESHDKGFEEGSIQALLEYNLVLKRPTYEEVITLLEKDLTDKILGNCLDKAVSLNNAAMEKGIWCQIVLFNYSTGSGGGFHAIVAFDTTDKGLIYIEPMADLEVELIMGEDYASQLCKAKVFCPFTKMFVKQIGVIK